MERKQTITPNITRSFLTTSPKNNSSFTGSNYLSQSVIQSPSNQMRQSPQDIRYAEALDSLPDDF